MSHFGQKKKAAPERPPERRFAAMWPKMPVESDQNRIPNRAAGTTGASGGGDRVSDGVLKLGQDALSTTVCLIRRYRGIFLGYLSSKTMSSACSQPARAAPLGAPRCGAPPARGLPGRATATARPSAPSARARPTRKPAVAREPWQCARRRPPATARERVERFYVPSSGGVLAPFPRPMHNGGRK